MTDLRLTSELRGKDSQTRELAESRTGSVPVNPDRRRKCRNATMEAGPADCGPVNPLQNMMKQFNADKSHQRVCTRLSPGSPPADPSFAPPATGPVQTRI